MECVLRFSNRPNREANELSDAEQKEFIIKDNASFGEWDFDCLANEWDVADLNDWGVDLPSFDSGDLDLENFFEEESEQDAPKDENNKIEIIFPTSYDKEEIKSKIKDALNEYKECTIK